MLPWLTKIAQVEGENPPGAVPLQAPKGQEVALQPRLRDPANRERSRVPVPSDTYFSLNGSHYGIFKFPLKERGNAQPALVWVHSAFTALMTPFVEAV